MKTYKCEEMMCEGCVNRIKKGLDGAGIKNTVDLSVKTVTIDGDKDCEAAAVEILDDLGFSAVEVQYRTCNWDFSEIIIIILKTLTIYG